MTSQTALEQLKQKNAEEDFFLFGTFDLVKSQNVKFKSYTKKNSGEVVNADLVFFSGYANTIDVDRINDKIIPKAFEKSIQEGGDYTENPVLGYNHYGVIGRVDDIKTDGKGLYVENAHVNPNLSQTAKDIAYGVKHGYYRTMSVMGRPKKWKEERNKNGDNIFVIEEFELVEISIVDVPMNPKALLDLKSANFDWSKVKKSTLREIQTFVSTLKQNVKRKRMQKTMADEEQEQIIEEEVVETSEEETMELEMIEEEIDEEEELEKTLTSAEVVDGINTIAKTMNKILSNFNGLEKRISDLENGEPTPTSSKSSKTRYKRTISLPKKAMKEIVKEAILEISDGGQINVGKSGSSGKPSGERERSAMHMKTGRADPNQIEETSPSGFPEESPRGRGALAKNLTILKKMNAERR